MVAHAAAVETDLASADFCGPEGLAPLHTFADAHNEFRLFAQAVEHHANPCKSALRRAQQLMGALGHSQCISFIHSLPF